MRTSTVLSVAYLLVSSATASPHNILEKRLFGLSFANTATTTSTDASNKATATTTATAKTTSNVKATIVPVTPVTPDTKQKAIKNEFWHTFKARGVNLGNWLVLEKWMNSAYYSNHSSSGTDEWTFCQTLGSSCEETLQAHWDDWITESDITQVAELGYNLLRIPVGFWAFIPTTGDEPYVHSTQLAQVERVLSYAVSLGLHVVLDIHGLPGSQNGKEHSGHEGSIDWYSADNQKRSLNAVTAAMNFIYDSPHKSVIAALEIANEPNITISSHRKTYESYLSSATKIIHSINASMPVMFHDGFMGPDSWSKFTKNDKDNYVIDVHQYYTQLSSNSLTALRGTCDLAKTSAKSKSKTPIFVGEFSVSIGGVYLDTSTWRKQYYETQVKEYSTADMAGSAFWSVKVFNTNSDTEQNNGWSMQALAAAGTISQDTWSTSDALTCPSTSS